jgi:hypothetical protein
MKRGGSGCGGRKYEIFRKERFEKKRTIFYHDNRNIVGVSQRYSVGFAIYNQLMRCVILNKSSKTKRLIWNLRKNLEKISESRRNKNKKNNPRE